eukprot:gene12525-15741_t
MLTGMRVHAGHAMHRQTALTGSVAPRSMVSRSARPGRRTVAAQANLFARIARLVTSTVNNFVTQAEDPDKLLDTVVMASQKRMEAKYKQAQELAVQKGEDELAKEALKRRKSFQEQATSLKIQLDAQINATDSLMGNTRVLETKLAEAKSKKDTLKARAASAKTSKQVQEMIGSLNTSSAVAAFDKMEEKVMAMEAEAETTQLLVAGDGLENKFALLESGTGGGLENKFALLESGTGEPIFCYAVVKPFLFRFFLVAGGGLENKFALLESGTVDDELLALKMGMKKGSSEKASPKAAADGRPLMKDAFDMELDALRKKARESA